MADIGIALIGAGSIADYHLGGLSGISGVAVRVVASRTLESAQAVAARYNIGDATSDVAAAVNRPDVAAVIITTPDDTHEALAIAAMQAGRAVLLQKPMATDSAACRRMLAVAEQTGSDLQVSWMHRHFEEVDAARSMIAAGAIGQVRTVRLRNATPGPDWGDWFFKKAIVSGGVVLQLGIHGIDLASHLFGTILTVSARTATQRRERRLRDGRVVPVENPDTAFAVYETDAGLLIEHEMSMIEFAGTDRYRMEIYGDNGALWLRTERGVLASASAGQAGWIGHTLAEVALGKRHHQRWVDGLLGRGPKDATAVAGLKSLLVAEAIAASAARVGACVPVEPV